MKTKHSALLAALDGRFDDHHAELARMLLDQIDALTTQIDALTARIDELLAAMPDAQPVDPHPGGPTPGPSTDTVSDAALGAVDRLDEIPGIGPNVAQVILAEIGLDMSRFPTAAHLVSWAKLCPRTIQSGLVTVAARPAKATPTSKVHSATPLPQPPRPTPSSVNATVASSNAAANSKPWSRSPAPSWSSSGTCSPTRTARFRDLGSDYHTSPDQHRTPNAQLHRATDGDGLPSHPRTRRLIQIRIRHNTTRLRQASPGAVACPLTLGIFPIRQHAGRNTPPVDRSRSVDK